MTTDCAGEMSTSLVTWSILKLNSSETKTEVIGSLAMFNILLFSPQYITLDGCIYCGELSSLRFLQLRVKLKFLLHKKCPCGFNTDFQNHMFFINKQDI